MLDIQLLQSTPVPDPVLVAQEDDNHQCSQPKGKGEECHNHKKQDLELAQAVGDEVERVPPLVRKRKSQQVEQQELVQRKHDDSEQGQKVLPQDNADVERDTTATEKVGASVADALAELSCMVNGASYDSLETAGDSQTEDIAMPDLEFNTAELASNDDEILWKAACTFFLHDVKDTSIGVQLPGFVMPSKHYQMVDVFSMLLTASSDEWRGLFNCLPPGLGKTYETVMVLSTIVLAFACLDDVRANQERHGGLDGPCALGNPFGIRCLCDPGSFGRTLVSQIPRAPIFITTKNYLCDQWMANLSEYLAPDVRHNGHVILQGPLLHPLMITENRKLAHGSLPTMRQDLTCESFRPHVVNNTDQQTPTLPDHLTMKNWAKRREVETVKGRAAALRIQKQRQRKEMQGTQGKGKKSKKQLEEEAAEPKIPVYAMELDQVMYHWPQPDDSNEDEQESPFSFRPILSSEHPERLVLIVSREKVAADIVDDMFQVTISCLQEGSGASSPNQPLIIERVFRPGIIIYDEFHEARSEASKTLDVLRELNQLGLTDHRKRPLTFLLSGTPFNNGPDDVRAIFSLVKAHHNVEPYMEKIDEASRTLRRIGTLRTKGKTLIGGEEQLTNERHKLRGIYQDVFKGGIIYREYSQCFLDTGEPLMALPEKHVHRPSFLPLPAKYSPLHTKMFDKLKVVIQERRREGHETSLESLYKTKEFMENLRTSILPGILTLLDYIGLDSTEDLVDESNRERLRESINHVGCEQVRDIKTIIQGKGSQRHGLLLTQTPQVAMLVYLWLQANLPNVDVQLINAKQLPPKRRQLIEDKRSRVSAGYDRPVVIVSTYTLLSTGVDGLQTFMDYVICFGHPFNLSQLMQGIGRIYRSGQKNEVDIHFIYGALGTLDHIFHDRLERQRFTLPGGGGISLSSKEETVAQTKATRNAKSKSGSKSKQTRSRPRTLAKPLSERLVVDEGAVSEPSVPSREVIAKRRRKNRGVHSGLGDGEI